MSLIYRLVHLGWDACLSAMYFYIRCLLYRCPNVGYEFAFQSVKLPPRLYHLIALPTKDWQHTCGRRTREFTARIAQISEISEIPANTSDFGKHSESSQIMDPFERLKWGLFGLFLRARVWRKKTNPHPLDKNIGNKDEIKSSLFQQPLPAVPFFCPSTVPGEVHRFIFSIYFLDIYLYLYFRKCTKTSFMYWLAVIWYEMDLKLIASDCLLVKSLLPNHPYLRTSTHPCPRPLRPASCGSSFRFHLPRPLFPPQTTPPSPV